MLLNRKTGPLLHFFRCLGVLTICVSADIVHSKTKTSFESNWAESYLIAALGDSISMAMNADGWGDAPDLGWSTGRDEDVRSHYERLQANFGRSTKVESLNAARSGAKSDELSDQVNQILNKRPNYVTILMGANDLCSWSKDDPGQVDALQNNVEKAVERLISARNDVKILISPIPDMYRLWEVGKVHRCQFRWNLARICKPLLHSNRSEDERQAFRKRQEQVNDALESIAEKFPINVKYAGKLMHYPFEWQHISSIDCFHPSKAGQSLLSDLTWKHGWFVQ